jgi:hypothetical protein
MGLRRAFSLIRLETHTQHIHIYLFFYIMHREPFLQMDSCSASGLFIPQFFFLYFSSSSCNTTKVKPGVIRTQQREKEPRWRWRRRKRMFSRLWGVSLVCCVMAPTGANALSAIAQQSASFTIPNKFQ